MKQLVTRCSPSWHWHHHWGLSSDNTNGTANAQFAPPSGQSGDALWHLPRFGEQGWFLHANNGRVRACNMDKVSVVGERAAPRCSKWTVD